VDFCYLTPVFCPEVDSLVPVRGVKDPHGPSPVPSAARAV
jgi:hypothetical protein